MEYMTIGVILLAFEYCYIIAANRLGIVDKPHHQSSHSGVVIRGGGLVFYFAFLVWSLLHDLQWYGGLIGLTILAMVSFIDDMRSVNPKIRLVCQFIAIILLFYHSGLIRTPLYVIILLSIICVGVLNICNFMDGINGMTGGYSLIVLTVLLYINEYKVHFAHSSLIIYIIISLLVFNIFNFRNKARCFAGDVGSLCIGFILVYLVLRLALRGHTMAWMAMLIVYAVDGGLTILHRILLKENLMKPHKKHAYQIMANELKMPHLMVSGIYMGLQAVCSIWFVISPGYVTLFLQLMILTLVYLWFMRKFYPLHVKNR